LEQSETKAQAALVTILCLTQITELKLLLDIGRHGHRFYDFVLTLLVACISLEIFVGVVIIYIGNLHYYRSATSVDDDGFTGSGSSSRRGTSSDKSLNIIKRRFHMSQSNETRRACGNYALVPRWSSSVIFLHAWRRV